MREILFDTETTGLDPERGDRLVEIACLELIDHCPTENVFHSYFNPERDMPTDAEKVHGLSTQFLSDKPRFAERVEELLAFISDSPLVAHNAAFDIAFLDKELDRIGRPPLANAVVCTLEKAREKHPGGKHSLDALCDRYGISRFHRTLHGAMLDSKLLAEVYIELTGGRQTGLSLASQASANTETHTGEATASTAPAPRSSRTPRPHSASAEEKQRHRTFVDSLVDPLWLYKGSPA